MRALMTVVALAALALPATARAEAPLRFSVFDGDPGTAVRPHLELPNLNFGAGNLGVDAGSGDGGGAERSVSPGLAFFLGFLGYGLGHFYAGSDRAWTWLAMDLALGLVGFVLLGTAVSTESVGLGVGFAIVLVVWCVERVWEAFDAYHFAKRKAPHGGAVDEGEREALAFDAERGSPVGPASISPAPAVSVLRL